MIKMSLYKYYLFCCVHACDAVVSVDLFVELKDKNPNLKPEVLVVRATNEILSNQAQTIHRGSPRISQKFGYYWNGKINLGPWIEFHKKAYIEDLKVFVWSLIIGYKDQDVAAALDLSPGTIRFRNDLSLKSIGQNVSGN